MSTPSAIEEPFDDACGSGASDGAAESGAASSAAAAGVTTERSHMIYIDHLPDEEDSDYEDDGDVDDDEENEDEDEEYAEENEDGDMDLDEDQAVVSGNPNSARLVSIRDMETYLQRSPIPSHVPGIMDEYDSDEDYYVGEGGDQDIVLTDDYDFEFGYGDQDDVDDIDDIDEEGDEDYDDDDDDDDRENEMLNLLLGVGTRRARGLQPRRAVLPPPQNLEPNPVGEELANNGEFGYTEARESQMKSRRKYPHTTGDKLFRREISYKAYPTSVFSQNMIPNTTSPKYLRYLARTYSGQFSEDGTFFFTATSAHDFKIRLYDTSHKFPWKLYKTVRLTTAQWTITDASLSRDNRKIAYSSITPVVYLASTSPDDPDTEVALNFNSPTANAFPRPYRSFGIWSIRFSADGREIVAGSNDNSLYVYDIEAQKVVLRLEGHTNDVNAVSFGDESGNILYSGSDDKLIKIWDRRSMTSETEAGVLPGHVEGITYVDSKRDGRYLISNGKDQAMKLWDIRKLVSRDRFSEIDRRSRGNMFDYRYQSFPGQIGLSDPNDVSVMSYYGHEVLQTLIRCHFAPADVAGGQYLYSGSSDGKVHIWSLDGRVAKVIDVAAQDAEMINPRYRHSMAACVRDASWHPHLPIIATSSWKPYADDEGRVQLHEWHAEADESLEGDLREQDGRRARVKHVVPL
ncbi:WD40-repeat-containing domain protein [Limtongia smithiae]|uniref:WD40-repeat-containing domain protein n=1 Tax=Limtongia smithiae TaxID=1125753 RepID=UPI0034CE8B88